MKRKTLVLLSVLALLSVVTGAQSEEVVTPKPTGRFGTAVKELREQNQIERKNLIEQNKKLRDTLKTQNKASREALLKENKEEREQFRTDTKNLLISKTPEERLTLMPTIKAGKTELMNQNKAERKTLQTTQWDGRKGLSDAIRMGVDSFRDTVKTRWSNLWGSFFGKK